LASDHEHGVTLTGDDGGGGLQSCRYALRVGIADPTESAS
jgi:hypothetical protein